ncbi:MAG: septum formation protein Maf [Thalassolituus sp.]|nr:MAG: septum formation protein Maf [Thalassolituus sp.]
MILASGSPRRRELLQQIGVYFSVQPADIDETPLADENAVAYVERMALEKARVVAQQNPDELVLGSDTSVILNGEILGKPVSKGEARETLGRLSGQTHEVLSAVALVRGATERVISVATKVRFRVLSDDEIRRYVDTGEPEDKAGSYGIQGKGAILVAGIEGSYSNVVGLPLTETAALLNEFDVPVWQTEEA